MINNHQPPTWLSDSAPEKTKELWWLHGHPHSERFANAKLTSLSALIRYNAREHGNDVAFLYPDTAPEHNTYNALTWVEFHYLTTAVANRYADDLKDLLATANASGQQPTVGLWGEGHTIEYFVSEMALATLNVRVLLLADNASSTAVAHLINVTSAQAIITDSRHPLTDITIQSAPMIETLLLDELSTCRLSQHERAFDDGRDGWNRHAFIIHSSGSTGLPKPITHTNRSLMQIARMYRLFPEFHVENWFLLFPLYHIAGFSIILSGLPNALITTFPPRQWPPRPSSIIQASAALKQLGHPIECIHTAPMVIESLVQYIESRSGDFSPLSELKILQPGGAMLPDAMVKKLTEAGVNVKTTYGSTEIGPPFRSIPHSRDNPECYRLANLYPDNSKIKMEEISEGLYECVVYNGFSLAAELWESPTDKKPYRTRDLFVQEPPGSGYFYLTGRLDDMLIHTSGENTNANPIELDIKSRCRFVKSLVLLGHARPCTSLIVEFHDLSSHGTDELLTVVEEVNKLYPKHSTILPSMVHVLPPGSHLPVTPKGSVKRKEAESIFTETIEALYRQVPATGGKLLMHKENLGSVIPAIISKVLGISLSDKNDDISLHDFGLDSIKAIQLRFALNETVGPISLGEIFESASVRRLIKYYQNVGDVKDSKAAHIAFIQEIIHQYCQNFDKWTVAAPRHRPQKECILLTGSSGSLGTALLERFAASQRVSKVFVLLRGDSERLSLSMASRGMDFEQVAKALDLEILPFNISDANLGLAQKDYERLSMEVTTVVQAAWKMDFNQSVEEFEKDCLQSCVNMMRFCMTGVTKVFSFISSVAACMGESSKGVIPEAPINVDPCTALGTGYAQSKYIVERVSQYVAIKIGLPIEIFRLGQMYGHTRTGSWNFNEMFPIMLATSVQLGALPRFTDDRMVDWIPVDDAASTICDVLTTPTEDLDNNSTSTLRTHNVVNPTPISWSSFLQEVQTALETLDLSLGLPLKEIPMEAWTEKLRLAVEQELQEGAVDRFRLHGSKLLNFFIEMARSDIPANNTKTPLVFDTSQTKEISPALRTCKPVNGELLRMCFERWNSNGVFDVVSIY